MRRSFAYHSTADNSVSSWQIDEIPSEVSRHTLRFLRTMAQNRDVDHAWVRDESGEIIYELPRVISF